MGRQKLCGLRPLENSALRFNSMCCGVTVAAMFAGAEATNSAASCGCEGGGMWVRLELVNVM